MIKKISTFLLLTTLFSFTLWFEIPSPNWFVNDLANTLTLDQKTQISDLISNIQQTTSAQIAVLIVPTIDWDDANLLASEIWTKWWVWEKWKDNWIIMLFAMEDRSRSIQVWYWLEWTIPDAIAKRIWENNIVPNFRDWNYFQWIYAAINDINLYIQKDPTVVETYSSANNNTTANIGKFNLFWMIFLFFMASSISRWIVPKAKRKNKKKWALAILIISAIWIIIWVMAWSIILYMIVWYIGMLLWIFGKWWNGWAWWWIIGGWGFGGWWWNSFWWFWWWGFGGGGGWWKR